MLGEKIKQFRELSKLSTTELADHLNVSVSTINRIENGDIELTVTRLLDIARYLKLSPIDFFEEKDLHTTHPDFFEKYGKVESSYIRFILGQNEILQRENARLQKEHQELMQHLIEQQNLFLRLVSAIEKIPMKKRGSKK